MSLPRWQPRPNCSSAHPSCQDKPEPPLLPSGETMLAPDRQFTWNAPPGGMSPDGGETHLVHFTLDHGSAQRELADARRIGLPVEVRILYFDLPFRVRGVLRPETSGVSGAARWRFTEGVEVEVDPGAPVGLAPDERESIQAGIGDALERGQPVGFFEVIDGFAAECGLRATDRVERWMDQLAAIALES